MAVPETFPFGFEVMGGWTDSATLRRKTWVRCFSADQDGRQAGRDAFSRIFDPLDLLLFESQREFRSAIALEPRRERFGGILLETAGHWNFCRGYRFWVHEDLRHEDRIRIAEIVQSRTGRGNE